MIELIPNKQHGEGLVMACKGSSNMRHENLVFYHADSLHSLKRKLQGHQFLPNAEPKLWLVPIFSMAGLAYVSSFWEAIVRDVVSVRAKVAVVEIRSRRMTTYPILRELGSLVVYHSSS